MTAVRDWVMNSIVKDKLGWKSAEQPLSWTELCYGRVKRKDFHTPYHCDAFNTIFERELLKTQRCSSSKLSSRWDKFRRGSIFDGNFSDLPIYTFWVALSSISCAEVSHLRLHIGSHILPNQSLVQAKSVQPEGYIYKKSNFVGPLFVNGTGYEQGDLVIFHCLTQHEANRHAPAKAHKECERVSMDGRFYFLPSTPL